MKENMIIPKVLGLAFLAYANFGALGATAIHHKDRLEREKKERGRQVSHTIAEETDDSNGLLGRYEAQKAELDKDKNERELIDKANEQWMRGQKVQLDDRIKEKADKMKLKHKGEVFDINNNRQWRDFKTGELKKSLGIRDNSDNKMNYLMEHTYKGDLYSDGALLCEYYDITEVDGFYFIVLTEYSIALAQPLSKEYREALKKESRSEHDWQFLVGSSTVIKKPSAIFLYDNGADVVPMKISLDNDYFTMYIAGTPVKLPASVSDYFIDPELIDQAGSKLKRMAKLGMWSAYNDLECDSNYTFRQEEVKTNDGYIPCIVVRRKLQKTPTPLNPKINEKISQLRL